MAFAVLASNAFAVPILDEQSVATPLDKRDNQCGTSSFTKILAGVSKGDAKVSDCEQLRDYLYKRSHTWSITASSGKIVNWGACTFYATVTGNVPKDTVAYLGNEDIADLTRDSITRYGQKDGLHAFGSVKFSSSGSMPCNFKGGNPGEGVEVSWNISK
ncbi:hypothetical protein C1H76_7905 [Elsinoe australis]|uniref:Ecp2 effector protein-like domain-containing protein n=1 Tax=Elsinoe australis TaxID=40998 RepID=A0A4U7AX89_9PEZI|nr:hypothetical protein C1H76_7905 [Elsinoe australis]